MRRSVPKAIAKTGVGSLCFGGMLLYYGIYFLNSVPLTKNHRPSEAGFGCIAFGIGLLLIGGALIFTAALLDRKPGTILAISLMALGSTSCVLAMAIAHTPMLMLFGVPAMVFGAIIGLMAILQHPSSEPRRE